MIAAIKNELVDRKRKAKKRINFMMLMAEVGPSAGSGTSSSFRTPGSAEFGAMPERPAAAIVMKEAYYKPFRKLYPVPDDDILRKMPFVIMRADHGHGDIFKSVLANVQPNVTQDLLDAGSGVYHATKLCFLTGILKDGVCRMTRAASMYSMFSHLDKKRNFGMQRFDSKYEIIISIKSRVLTQ